MKKLCTLAAIAAFAAAAVPAQAGTYHVYSVSVTGTWYCAADGTLWGRIVAVLNGYAPFSCG